MNTLITIQKDQHNKLFHNAKTQERHKLNATAQINKQKNQLKTTTTSQAPQKITVQSKPIAQPSDTQRFTFKAIPEAVLNYQKKKGIQMYQQNQAHSIRNSAVELIEQRVDFLI